MDTELQKILQMNRIQDGLLAQAIHQDIREIFLREICTYMKTSPAHSLEIRRLYFRSYDDLQTVRTIVRRAHPGRFPTGSGRTSGGPRAASAPSAAAPWTRRASTWTTSSPGTMWETSCRTISRFSVRTATG